MAKLIFRARRITIIALLVAATLLIWMLYSPGATTSTQGLVAYRSEDVYRFDDVPIPSSWTDHDWSAAPAGADEQAKTDASIKRYAFNAYKSASVPLRRPLPDYRIPECRAIAQPPQLPAASVIICFVNEMWSSLLRTVWSVLDTTPKGLLREIILVNDASDADWLKDDFQKYVAALPLVKMVSSTTRLGLIKARMLGARNAGGDVLIFLDSHCEATTGWIEPILARIAEQPQTVICPSIDTISDRTLDYGAGGSHAVGGFFWTLDFNWQYHDLGQHKPSDPMPSATMAGGLFAIGRAFWFHLGEYDDAMRGWGGENLELSFRIWMCGGRMEFLPCSHVGHIFRGSHPYDVPGGFNENFIRNSARLAEVWLDEYKDAYFFVRPGAKKMDIGDLSARKALRQRLQCTSFKAFFEKFFPDQFVPLPKELREYGQLMQSGGQCVDSLGRQHPGESPGLYPCHTKSTASQNQAYLLTTTGQLRIIWDLCLALRGASVVLHPCGADHAWEHDAQQRMRHVPSGKCLDSRGSDLIVAECSSAPTQHWTFSGYVNA